VKPKAAAPNDDQVKAARVIPTWAGRYARNRTLPSVVFFVTYALGTAALVGLASAAERAYEHGERTQAALFASFAAAVFAWLLWFVFAGGRTISRAISARMYGKEGAAATAHMEQVEGQAQSLSAAQLLVLCCVAVWFVLFLAGVIPSRQLLPTSAVFVVPFLSYVFAVKRRDLVSPFMLVWPALYAVHALLLVMGAPIYIEGGPRGLYEAANMVVPTLGYGLFAALLGHLYSRFALHRLRALAGPPERDAADLA